MSELERQLEALGRELAFPPVPDLAVAVRRRLDERPRRPFPWRRAAVLALAVLAVAIGAAFAVPQARTTILKWFHLRGVTVERVDTLPSAKEQPLADRLGRPLSRAAAERAVGFRMLLPSFSGNPPKRFYVLEDALASVLLHVPGHGTVLLSEFRASGFDVLKKVAVAGTLVEPLRVDGEEGLWVQGGSHVLTYVDRFGQYRERSILITGNVLLWLHHDLTLRLEGKLTKAQALRIAKSVS